MNHEALTELARTVEKTFSSTEEIESHKSGIDFLIKFCATHLPHVSAKSKPEDFMELDDLQKSIRKISALEVFLDQMQAAVFELKDS